MLKGFWQDALNVLGSKCPHGGVSPVRRCWWDFLRPMRRDFSASSWGLLILLLPIVCLSFMWETLQSHRLLLPMRYGRRRRSVCLFACYRVCGVAQQDSWNSAGEMDKRCCCCCCRTAAVVITKLSLLPLLLRLSYILFIMLYYIILYYNILYCIVVHSTSNTLICTCRFF